MMSQMDSRSRAARSPAATGGGPSMAGKFMSAILTYFPLVVTEKGFATNGFRNERIVSAGPAPEPSLRWRRKRALMGPLKHNGCWRATQKRPGRWQYHRIG